MTILNVLEIKHNRKDYEKEYIYMYTTESLCCTAEVNTTPNQSLKTKKENVAATTVTEADRARREQTGTVVSRPPPSHGQGGAG